MGTNRTQPFGYRKEFGKVVIDPDEARWVVYIYEQYIQGASFKNLLDTLCGTGIRYDADRLRTKNMVAGILQDRRCIGEGIYPQIIDECIFYRVNQKRSKRALMGAVLYFALWRMSVSMTSNIRCRSSCVSFSIFSESMEDLIT